MRPYQKVKTFILTVVILTTGLPASFAADEQGKPVALETLIQEALLNNPQLRAAREDLKAARQRVPQSSSLPDPTVGSAYMGRMLETALGPQEDVYEFEQTIPFPGKLIEKRKMAVADTKAANARVIRTEQDLMLKVTETYYDLYAVTETLSTVEEIKGLLEKFQNIAQSRYSSLAGSQRDVARVQVEVSQTLEQVFILEQERQSLISLLKALLNREGSGVIRPVNDPVVPKTSLDLDQLLQSAAKNRPELLEASALKERDRHALSLSRYEYAPDFSIGFQYTRIGDGTTTRADDGRDAWMIPWKVTVPLWQGRVASEVSEARSNWKASEERFSDAENFSDYEVKNAYYRFIRARQVVDLYQNAYLPQTQLAFHSDQSAYEAGTGDILNFIDSQKSYLNARVSYVQAVAEAMKDYAALNRAVGQQLPGQSPGTEVTR